MLFTRFVRRLRPPVMDARGDEGGTQVGGARCSTQGGMVGARGYWTPGRQVPPSSVGF